MEEIPNGAHPIVGVSTSVAAFIDFFPRGPVNQAVRITSFGDFQREFGGLDERSEASYAIQQFYLNGGQLAWVIRVDSKDIGMDTAVEVFPQLEGGDNGALFDLEGKLSSKQSPVFAKAILGNEDLRTGMYALENIEPFGFNLLCLPAAAYLNIDDYKEVYSRANAYCEKKRAFLLVDIPDDVDTFAKIVDPNGVLKTLEELRSASAAVYFPRLEIPDELNGSRKRSVGPSGTIAGMYARIDASRGVWKAPAGTEATLTRVSLPVVVNEIQNSTLNGIGINVLRNFPKYGTVNWGARTLEGADAGASEWKYVPVRRTALFIEGSLYQGLKWVVSEPNGEPLWAEIRLHVGEFMYNLYRRGAFQGQSQHEAYFVRCDSQTTTQNDIDNGIVNVVVGFAPLKPSEFVVVQIRQVAG